MVWENLCMVVHFSVSWFEPPHDKTNRMTFVPSEDSDQPGHPPSLIRVFAVCSVGSWWFNVSSCGRWRLWSDWADVQADLSLHWVHRSFCWFCHEAAHLYLNSQQINTSVHLLYKLAESAVCKALCDLDFLVWRLLVPSSQALLPQGCRYLAVGVGWYSRDSRCDNSSTHQTILQYLWYMFVMHIWDHLGVFCRAWGLESR